jgi:hypothetical protein
MVMYVQGAETDTSHSCRNCSEYPEKILRTQPTRPRFDLCQQCLAKEKANNCS